MAPQKMTFQALPTYLHSQNQDKIESLMWSLRRTHAGINVTQITDVSDLLVALAERNAFPETVEAFADTLTPVLATNPVEQQELHQNIVDYFQSTELQETLKYVQAPTGVIGGTNRASSRERASRLIPETKRLGWGLALLFSLVLVGTIAAVYHFNSPPDILPRLKIVRLPLPTQPTIDQPSKFLAPDVSRAGKVSLSKIQVTLPDAPLRQEFASIRALVWFLPLVLFLWSAFKYAQRKRWQRSVATADTGDLSSLRSVNALSALHVDKAFSRSIQQLRSRFFIPTRKIDIKRTIDAISRSGGVAEICYASHAVEPEYLFLIEQKGETDHTAKLFFRAGPKVFSRTSQCHCIYFSR